MKVIDKFSRLIPPLSSDEFKQLEQNILADGIREPLVLWGDVLIDGHNRYKIAQKHGLSFKTVQKDFPDETSAERWVILNQFGRRNLSAYDRSLLALKLKPIIVAEAKERQKNGGWAAGNIDRERKENLVPPTLAGRDFLNETNPNQKTLVKSRESRDELASIAGVSHGTMAKVEKIEKQATPEIKKQLKSGNMSINQAYKAVKAEEKKREVEAAKKAVAKETKQNPNAPVLYVGDSIKNQLGEEYDLLLTDPPYSTDVENLEEFVEQWFYKALNGVKKTGFAYVFIGAYPDELKTYLNAKVPPHMHLEQVLIWTYKNTLGNNPKDRYKQNYQACLFFRGETAPALNCPLTSEQWAVQEINAPDGRIGDRYHAWQKPIEIAERFIRHSTKQGALVYDPFACTGTFLLAASKLGRRAIGYEINAENAKIAYSRGCVNGEHI